MKPLLFLISIVLLSMTACQSQTSTVIIETVEPDVAQRSVDSLTTTTKAAVISTTIPVEETEPAKTPEVTKTVPTVMPSDTPTKAPTATPTNLPPVPSADIEIQAPGALSKVTSPIPIRALLVPGHRGRVSVELLGEDGRVITKEIIILNPDLGRKAGMVIELAFEIPGEAEFSRLVISRQDEYGRISALASTNLVLLSSGQPDYNVVVDNFAPVAILEPQLNAIIQGDSLVVAGIARPAVVMDFIIEMIAQNGKILAQRSFNVSITGPDGHIPFIIEVPYSIEEPTWALLLIREQGDRIAGITYLTSTEVLLSP